VPLRSLSDLLTLCATVSQTASPVSGILGHRKSQFKGHLEARHARSPSVELDTREVVNGVGTFPDELEDSLKTALAGGDFERRARDQPKSGQTGNIGPMNPSSTAPRKLAKQVRASGHIGIEFGPSNYRASYGNSRDEFPEHVAYRPSERVSMNGSNRVGPFQNRVLVWAYRALDYRAWNFCM